MLGRDLAKVFRTVPFASEAEAEAVVGQIGQAAPSELVKIVPVLAELGQRGATPAQELRCRAFAGLVLTSPSPELFRPFLRALRGADALLAQTLVTLLPRVNDVEAHGDLCELLSSTEAEVRGLGAEVLKQIGGRTALEILTRRISDPVFPGRMDAMNALVPRAGSHALPLLGAVLKSGRPLEKIHALRHLASPERFARDLDAAVDTATIALDDKDDLVVAQAIDTVGQLDEDGFWDRIEPFIHGRGIDVLKSFLKRAAARPTDGAVAFFRERFRAGPKAVRLLVIEAAELSAAEPFFGLLVEALSHRDVATRTRAAHAVTELARSSRIDAARAVVWLLRSKDVNVRRIAAEIANRIEDKEGVLAPRLLQFLRDEDWWVRERVLDALVEMNASGITKHLIVDYLGDASAVVRRFAVSALLRIRDQRALGALVRSAQTDEDWLVRELAVEAVGKLGDMRAVPYLLELLQKHPDLRLVAIRALTVLRAKDALADVADQAQDENPDVRAAALDMLYELDDGSFALFAKGCEDDPSPEVRKAAARLLGRFQLQRVATATPLADARSLEAILGHVVAQGADDAFLFAGRAPSIKKLGQIHPLGSVALSAEQIRELIWPVLTTEQRERVDAGRDIDFSYDLTTSGARFRVNLFSQLTGPAAVFRTVKDRILPLAELGAPPIIETFANLPHGLVLVGGPTGAGKSTTLAALIDHINRNQARHIITMEDPIEVVHGFGRSLINQRELGSHTRSLGGSLRSALRQDPDVLLVGELRDLETIAFAVTAAETGHLVLGTVHTTSADSTIDRMINAFPRKQQEQVRSMLAESLRAVTCQYLLRSPRGGRSLAVEVMINNDAIQSLVRKGKTFQIPTIIATSREQGMQLMDTELIRLARGGLAEVDDAYAKALDKRGFEAALGLASSEDGVPAAGPASARVSVVGAPTSPGRPSITSMPAQGGAPPAAGRPSLTGMPAAGGSMPPPSSARPSLTGMPAAGARPGSSMPPGRPSFSEIPASGRASSPGTPVPPSIRPTRREE